MKYKHWTIAILIGLFSAFIGNGIWHLYVDHVTFHNLINSVIQNQQRQQGQK